MICQTWKPRQIIFYWRKQLKNNKRTEYSYQTDKLSSKVTEDLRNNTMEKVEIFAQIYFLQKGLKYFGREGRDQLTKDMDQIYRWNVFEPI